MRGMGEERTWDGMSQYVSMSLYGKVRCFLGSWEHRNRIFMDKHGKPMNKLRNFGVSP